MEALSLASPSNQSKKSLSEAFPDVNTLGLLLLCDPYCQFVSLNEGKRWNPELDQRLIDPNKLRLIRPQDPEYDLLVSKHPVLPYVETKNDKSLKETHDPRMTPIENKRKSEGDGWLVSYNLGAGLYKGSTHSDNRILSASASPSLLLSPQVLVELRPLTVWTFFSLNVRPVLTFQTFSTESGKSVDNEFTISYRQQSAGLELRVLHLRFQSLLGLELNTTDLSSSGNIVDSYPLKTQTALLRLGIAQANWKLTLATNIYSSLNESQGFRQEPFQRQLYDVTANYCSRRYLKFGFRFSACGNLSWSQDRQTTNINPALVTGFNESQVTFQNIFMGMSLQFGDLLWE